MTRQYFCWKVALTYRCGCTEYTPTSHSCGPQRQGCTSWLTNKTTDKDCDTHRVGGLHSSSPGSDSDSRSSSSPSSSAGYGEEEGVAVVSPRRGVSGGEEAGRRVGYGEGEGQGVSEADGMLEGSYLRRRV